MKHDERLQQTVIAKELHTVTWQLVDGASTTDDKETEINTPGTYQWILTPDEQLYANDCCWFATQTYLISENDDFTLWASVNLCKYLRMCVIQNLHIHDINLMKGVGLLA